MRWRDPTRTRSAILRRQRAIHRRVPCPHFPEEIEAVTNGILERAEIAGAVAEFGCFKGGSTAKLSLACAHAGKRLLVFDSFEGLPEPADWDVEHRIERPRRFRRGEYAGSLDEVRRNVARYGRIDVCEFVPGWFSDTLAARPEGEMFAVAFVDVDLAESTRTVLEHVWPRLVPGGAVFVHHATDAKLQDVIEEVLDGAHELFAPRLEDLPQLETKTLAWALRAD